MSDLSNTFSDFFGPMIKEDNQINLGNCILKDLEELGYDFNGQRQILCGEMNVELPSGLANFRNGLQVTTVLDASFK